MTWTPKPLKQLNAIALFCVASQAAAGFAPQPPFTHRRAVKEVHRVDAEERLREGRHQDSHEEAKVLEDLEAGGGGDHG